MTALILTDMVHELYAARQTYIDAMNHSGQMNAVSTIINLIEEVQK